MSGRLEADGRYHPKHWCAWCGENRGRELMELVVHHATEAKALRCVDQVGCMARVAAARSGRSGDRDGRLGPFVRVKRERDPKSVQERIDEAMAAQTLYPDDDVGERQVAA